MSKKLFSRKGPRGASLWGGVILLPLLAVVGYQLVGLLPAEGVRWAKALWRTREMTGIERSARFYLGTTGATFMGFLDTAVPSDAPVVLPERAVRFSHQSILQFYLMPRAIIACDCGTVSYRDMGQECLTCLRRTDRYVPAIGEFPPDESVLGRKRFLPAREGATWLYQGVYAPLQHTPPEPLDSGQPTFHWSFALLVDACLIAGLVFLGLLLARAIFPSMDVPDALVMALPLGGGLFTWAWFLSSWMGLPITLWSATLVFGLLLLPLIVRNRRELSRIVPESMEQLSRLRFALSRRRLIAIAGWAILAILCGTSLLASITQAYSTYDGIANWALKGYGIAHEGTVFAGSKWGGHGLSYPQNLPLLIALFRVTDGDVAAGSKLLFPLFAGTLLLGVHRFLRGRGVRSEVSLLWMLLLATTPVLFLHSTIGFANLVFTAYLVLGSLALWEGALEGDAGRYALGTLLLAFGAWTRPEGLLFGLALALTILLALRMSGHRVGFNPWLGLALAVIPAAWLGLSISAMAGDEIGRTFRAVLGHVLAGDFQVQKLRFLLAFVVSNLLTTQVWGAFFPLTGFILVLGAFVVRPKPSPRNLSLLLLTLAAVAFPLALLYGASFAKSDLATFLQVSFDRAFFPATVLLGVLGALSSDRFLTATAQAPSESKKR